MARIRPTWSHATVVAASKQFKPPRVVVAHTTDELVEDVVPVDPEGENGPAQRRPVIEDLIGLVPPPRREADALGSGHQLRDGRMGRPRHCLPGRTG